MTFKILIKFIIGSTTSSQTLYIFKYENHFDL